MGRDRDDRAPKEAAHPRWASLLARLQAERPRSIVAFVVLLTLLSAWPLAHARFSGDLTDLLPEDSSAAQAFRRFRAAFGEGDQLVVVALPAQRESARPSPAEWIAALRERLVRRPEVRRVEGGPLEALTQFGSAVLPSAGFAFLTAEEATRLRETLSPEGLARAFARDVRLLETSPGLETNELVRRDPLFLRELLAGRAGRFLGGGAAPADPGFALLSIAGFRPAQDVDASRALVAAVDAEIAATDAHFTELGAAPRLRLLKTGGYAIAVEDSARVRADLQSSTAGSVVLVLLLFVLGYRGLAPLVLVTLPLLLGVAWGYALFLALRGGITMLTAVGAAMLVGLGIDFGVHLYAELIRARDEGLEPAAARRAMVERAAPRIAVAALTSVGCFLAFAFTGFRGLSDLGLLAGVGLLACLAAYLLVFPLLLVRHEPRRGRTPLSRVADLLASVPLRRPRGALAAAAAITLVAGVVLVARGPPPFVGDARLLHPDRSPALDALAELDRIVKRPLVPWVLIAEGAEGSTVGDADELATRFARLESKLEPLVDAGELVSFELPSRALPPRSEQEAAFAALAGLDGEATARELRAQAEAAGFDPDAFSAWERALRDNLARAARRESLTLAELRRLGAGSLADTFFRESDGRLVAAGYLFPQGGLLPGPEQSQRVERVAAALAGEPGFALTGFPVVAAELASRVQRDFRGVTGAAIAVVVLLVLVSCRSIRATALALLPVGLALVWVLAAMRLIGTPFNVLNVVLLPMLVGLGVDNGVHLVFDTRQTGDVARSLRGVLLPMLVSTVTTVAGFGSLVTVGHPAIASMGELAGCGILLCLLATLLVLPPLLARGAPPRSDSQAVDRPPQRPK